jgi:hypothetical protein
MERIEKDAKETSKSFFRGDSRKGKSARFSIHSNANAATKKRALI